MENNPARWVADPSGRHELRYWDGWSWTDWVADRGQMTQDPLYPTAAPTQPIQVAEPEPEADSTPTPTPVAEPEPQPVFAGLPTGPMVLLTSWPYDDVAESRRKATDLFDRLKQGPTGTGGRHEIALIDAGQWWMVALGGLADASGVLDSAYDLFRACGGLEQPVANEFQRDPADDLLSVAVDRGWGRVVDYFNAAESG